MLGGLGRGDEREVAQDGAAERPEAPRASLSLSIYI